MSPDLQLRRNAGEPSTDEQSANTRWVPLYDASATPPLAWNERMQPGEYAVHPSFALRPDGTNGCAILPSLVAAEAFAHALVQQHPILHCRIFDHHGFVGAPASEVSGKAYKGRSEITPRFRRWVGSVLFVGGSVLFLTDWVADFYYDWPSVLGSRLLMPGFVLLVTEGLLVLHARHKARHAAQAQP